MLIKAPNGTKWKVYWKKINGEIWFGKGWKTFTENYSLGHGSLVVFEYKRTSKFDVHIFDQNAVEIDYDSSSDTDDEKDNVDDHSDDESVEILDEWLNRKKARQRPPFVSPRPHKKVRGLVWFLHFLFSIHNELILSQEFLLCFTLHTYMQVIMRRLLKELHQ